MVPASSEPEQVNGSLLSNIISIMKFFYVYVLQSFKDGLFYIGSTNDLKRRLREHQQGKNISTEKRLPLELIYFEAHRSKKDAERRENYFKTTKGKVTLRQLLRSFLSHQQID